MTYIHGVFPTRYDLALLFDLDHAVNLHAVCDSGSGHVHTQEMADPTIHAVVTPSGGSSPAEITGPEIRPDDIPLRYPVNVLASYYYFRTDNMEQIASWGLRILADSGAFSAETRGVAIDIEDYARWITRWRDSLYWAASLDVIGDHQASLANWHNLRELGVETVPTIHFPADPKAMDVYVDNGATLVGLGGMVPHSSSPDKLLRWTLSCFRHGAEHHPGVRFHGWGVNHKRLLFNLPWFSVDSSGFAASYRYGRAELFDPDTLGFVKVDITRGAREMAAHRKFLEKHYGVEWSRVVESVPESRRDVTRMAIRSLQLLEDYLSQRWANYSSKLFAVLGGPYAQPTLALNPADVPPDKEQP